ncbi:MAG: PAS domain S-box protein, partial [Vicinamibacterales bacterium]
MLHPWLAGASPQVVLLLPVMAAAAAGGLWAGLAGTATAALLADRLWFAPDRMLAIPSGDRGDLLMFVAVALAMCVLGARLDEARGRERTARRASDAEADRFALLAAAAPDVICAFQQAPDGRVSFPYGSEKVAGIYGIPAEDLRRDASVIFSMMHPDDGERVRRSIEASAGTLGIWRDEFRVQRADGRECWVEGHSTPVREPDGGLTWYGVIADVTARKRAARTAELWARLFDGAHIGIAAADPATDCWIAANRTYAAWRGYAPEELIGRHVETAYPPERQAAATARVREAERAGHAVFETELLRRDGSRFPAMVDLTVLRDATGRPIERVGFIIDLSALRRAEDAAHLWQRAFEQSMLSIALSDTSLTFVAVNAAFASSRGYTPADLVGRPVSTVFPEDTWPAVAAFIQAAGDHWTLEAEHRRRDGGRFPVLIDATGVRDDTGTIVNRIVFVQDLTARVRAEQALRRSERQLRELNAVLESRVRERTAQLEAANAELEAFAYSVSHDLRAPLRGIEGWSLALLEDFGPGLEEQARQYLHRVRAEAQRMGVLIDALLRLSRVGRAALAVEPIDLSATARAIVSRLTEQHPERAIDFTIEPGLTAYADARLLDVALTNLLENAVKFTRGRTPARIVLGREDDQDADTFYVRDNGVGFDMAYADGQFRPFKRLHRESEFPGTGIGLATVQRI